MAKEEAVKFVTPVFRASFPALFAPKKAGESGDLKYSVSAIFRTEADPAKPGEEVLDAQGLKLFAELRALATAAAIKKWGSLDKLPKAFQGPFRPGTDKDYDGYGPGTTFCTFSSKYKPLLVDGQGKEIIDPNELYGGCYLRAKVHAYAWEYMGKAGVSFSLWSIQKHHDGKPFRGGGDPATEFDSLPLPAGSSAPATPAQPAAAASGGGFGL